MGIPKKTGVIGLMSGTSLDGLDCCYVEFWKEEGLYQYGNLLTQNFPYDDFWRTRLKQAFYLQPEELQALDLEYGTYLGQRVKEFIRGHDLAKEVELIASHGHTVFHKPALKQTVQIGDGATLQRLTGIPVINNFRITDVLLGGQGAPLVPVGDHLLFHQYDACLNLGGFSNISLTQNQTRIAFDIGPCNLPINELCTKHFGRQFDANGDLARSGKINPALLDALNDLPYYKQTPPKSLSYEWLSTEFQPILNQFAHESPQNLLASVTAHAAQQIRQTLDFYKPERLLVTGGGAYNQLLIDLLSSSKTEIVRPESELIEFKEALIFAFLGYLNLTNTINTYKSVTGASQDSIGGIRHFGHQQ